MTTQYLLDGRKRCSRCGEALPPDALPAQQEPAHRPLELASPLPSDSNGAAWKARTNSSYAKRDRSRRR